MLSAPDPYPLVSSHNPAPDDAEIQSRTPQICVDYLSHNWKDEDVWNSWKAMTKRKNEIANGVRLENASWRTWAKQRGNLKTVSPETLNWLKESDVTWLYGPLHGDAPAVPPPKVASTAERLGIDVLPGKKSILKHRTLSEILQTPMTVSPPNEESHTEAIVKPREVEEPSKAEPARERNTTLTLGVLKSNRKDPPKKNRHISFNTLVEQCIALEENPHSYFYGDYSDEEDEEEEEEYEEEDEDKDHSVHGSINSLLSPPKQARSLDKVSDKPVTIAMMPPTQLKTGHDYLLPNYDDVLDGDEEEVSELNTRYSVADTVPETHDLPIDQDDGYDYYDSDEDFEADEPPTYSYPTSRDAGSEGTYLAQL